LEIYILENIDFKKFSLSIFLVNKPRCRQNLIVLPN
jgi:hypothetical protein